MRSRQPTETALRRGERATWGARPDGPPATVERPRMRLRRVKPFAKGLLRGFTTVELPIGLLIHDCLRFLGKNGVRVALSAKPVIDREGRHAKPDGKAQYAAATLEWPDRRLADRFSAAAVELVQGLHPEALTAEAL